MGDSFQLVNPAAADRTKYFANIDPRDESCLSVNISASKLLQEKRIAGTCPVSSSINHTAPVARNTFVIERFVCILVVNVCAGAYIPENLTA